MRSPRHHFLLPVIVAVLVAPIALGSEGARPFAAPEVPDAPAGTIGGLMEISFALLIVLAAIFGFAWLARRARMLAGGARGRIAVVADLPLGVKERVVLIRVRDVELLLGVTPGQVSTLHAFAADEPATGADEQGPPSATQRPPSFAELLRKSLGR